MAPAHGAHHLGSVYENLAPTHHDRRNPPSPRCRGVRSGGPGAQEWFAPVTPCPHETSASRTAVTSSHTTESVIRLSLPTIWRVRGILTHASATTAVCT